jgi:gliding motility-associated-like protein
VPEQASLDRILGTMTKTLTYLIVLHSCFLLSHSVSGQCGYNVTIHTNNNYCVGSSLIATSTHAMQKITWYRNGQLVSTVIGSQSLSTKPIQIPIFLALDSVHSTWGDVRLGADDADNIYMLYDDGYVLKTKLLGGTSEMAYISDRASTATTDMYVDPAGNVYIASWNNRFSTGATTLVWEVPTGSVSTGLPDIPTAMPLSAIPNSSTASSNIFLDCQKNIYLYDAVEGALYRYPPGAATATLIGSGIGTWAKCSGYNWGFGAIHMDQAGNIFFLSGSYVMKFTPGAAATTVAVPGNCLTDQNRLIYDFYLDGSDTIYLTGIDLITNTAFVEKWAPGASAGQQLFNSSLQKNTNGIIPITMDRHGNIFVGYNNYPVDQPTPNLSEYVRTTSIDSAFAPTDTGSYYAVVTDIQGYTATSDTFHVNAPATAPSIRITASATSTPVCTPITFTAQVTNPGSYPTYQWMVSGVPAGGDSSSYSYNLFASGDQVYCIFSTQAGCAGPVQDSSNVIDLSIDPQGAAAVTIAAAPKTSICTGQAITFTATVTNGSNSPVFEWLVNGDSTGDVNSTFTRSNFSNDDVVTCLIVSDDACGLAKSNSIPLTVSIPPVIQPGQIFTIPRGGSLTLDPVISGTVNTWAWSPGAWLSDSTIQDPVADPPATITYTLMVEANGGCGDTATVLVDVFTPLALPNAFTPNGDGRNDRFYVLGGPVNSVVETFGVFNRWGQAVFRVHDAAPGDASAGWDGRVNGSFVPPGTYVYVVVMRFATGARQTYKGTVEVIR